MNMSRVDVANAPEISMTRARVTTLSSVCEFCTVTILARPSNPFKGQCLLVRRACVKTLGECIEGGFHRHGVGGADSCCPKEPTLVDIG